MQQKTRTSVATIKSAMVPGTTAPSGIDPHLIVQNLPVGVAVFHTDDGHNFRLTFWNERGQTILSGPDGQYPLHGALATELPGFQASGSPVSRLKMAIHSQQPINFDWVVPMNDLDAHFRCRFLGLEDDRGGRQVLCTFIDRTAEKRAERNLLHRALHDSLTGLPNRSLFLEILQEIVEEARSHTDRHCAILIINIDRFQLVNESFGHKLGDKFLVQIAGRLRMALGPNDVLARLNGDEFAILSDHLTSIESVAIFAEKVHEVLRKPFIVTGDEEVYLSVCIGIASTFSSVIHAEHLIRDADFAMHQAKSTSNGRTEIFQRDIHQPARAVFQMETALRKALEQNSLELHYQPIVNLETGRVEAIEALARWNSPEKGFIAPSDFIPLAEETGLIVPLGRWALVAACKEAQRLRQTVEGMSDLVVNVNVSGVQFTRDNVIEAVQQALEQSGLPGPALKVEITESAIMDNPELAAEILYELKTFGVSLALDDFGTGYSSLNYLHRFPIDCLKIDRSFISQVDENNEKAKIISIITSLAENLGLTVVAEGIESAEQGQLVHRLGCTSAQGYHYARPLPVAKIEEYLRTFED